jgi:hypothetical protein
VLLFTAGDNLKVPMYGEDCKASEYQVVVNMAFQLKE